MSVLDNKWTVYEDPTYPAGGPVMFPSSRWEPSAVDRLAALEDPKLAARIEAWDELHSSQFEPFDMVPDPATPNAVPQSDVKQ